MDKNNLFENVYNPDVLSCLANLSNDEVFTPPEVVNNMLDLLPEEIWKDKNAKFLDPVCKSGVFLREISKRLIDGLEDQIPDLEERLDHIFKNQVYGIAITELTSLLARRTVYCSKYPNSIFSIADFDNVSGNIIYRNIDHTWDKNRCVYCGAPKSQYKRSDDLETHAYEFIHREKVEEIFNMKFDVIVGNPPYQLSDGGAGASAKPIYNLFVEQAKKLNPRYMTMIIPARWYSGGKGLDKFRDDMITDKRITKLIDYPNPFDCFPGIPITGGVCYFLWERENTDGICEVKNILNNKEHVMKRPLVEDGLDILIRYNKAVDILRKVNIKSLDINFSEIISSRKPFGLSTNFSEYSEIKTNKKNIKVYGNGFTGYIEKNDLEDSINDNLLKAYKVFISYAYGGGEGFPHQIVNKPFIGEVNSCSTETYLAIGPFPTKEEAKHAISYIKTKFFRFLVMLLKNTQHATKRVYRLVPMQDFSKPWTDKELYEKYNLTEEEIEFIESMIKPMD